MSLSNEQILHVARLARIALGPDEVAVVGAQLNSVLGLIDAMQAVDTTGIEPMSHALDATLGLAQRLRPDGVTESDRHELYQAGAPAVERGLYLVPKVIE